VTHPRELELETLSREALDAAERGRWDRVEACYQRRGRLFATTTPSPLLAQRLRDLDRMVAERARIAKAAVEQLMAEATATRRRLDRFASRLDDSKQPSHRVDRRA
jgi:hypothetical protein